MPKVLIIAQSAASNVDLRNEVRRTWAKACLEVDWCFYAFSLGLVEYT